MHVCAYAARKGNPTPPLPPPPPPRWGSFVLLVFSVWVQYGGGVKQKILRPRDCLLVFPFPETDLFSQAASERRWALWVFRSFDFQPLPVPVKTVISAPGVAFFVTWAPALRAANFFRSFCFGRPHITQALRGNSGGPSSKFAGSHAQLGMVIQAARSGGREGYTFRSTSDNALLGATDKS